MKIVVLTAENFKKLKAVHIAPEGNIVQITGANGEGKTSVLDSIWAAIDAAGYLKETKTKEPIRQGEKRATVMLDLGELVITRKFLPSGATVEVTTKDGASYKSPQAILDALVGKISFDPLAFSMMDDKKQRELLLSMVTLDIDLEANAAKRKELYESRTESNRVIKQLEGQLAGLPAVPPDTPDKERSAAEVLTAQREAQSKKEQNDLARQGFRDFLAEIKGKMIEADNFQASHDNIDIEIAELKEKIAELELRKKEYSVTLKHVRKKVSEMKSQSEQMGKTVEKLSDPDMTVFETQLNELEAVNAAVRVKTQRSNVTEQINIHRVKSQRITDEMDALDLSKEKAMNEAKFPVSGMSFNDNGVLYNGVPFTQCSSAERLRVSIAMAMSMNPKLRVIRIADGSLLDSKNMAIIEEMAKDNDFQCFIERVDESGKIGIVIEDGEVKA